MSSTWPRLDTKVNLSMKVGTVEELFKRFDVLKGTILFIFFGPDLMDHQPPNYTSGTLQIVKGILACHCMLEH